MNLKITKQILLNQLYTPYRNCMQCPLGAQGRKQVVFGAGNPDADLFFIGEAPGATEDTYGLPFIGKSGQLLNKVLQLADIKREDVFISSIIKCRPPGNRKPFPNEIATCKNLLLDHQIKIVNPKVICTLGSTAIEGILEKSVKISQLRGQRIIHNNIILIPTFHPAYILRNPQPLQLFIKDISLAAHLTKTDTYMQ